MTDPEDTLVNCADAADPEDTLVNRAEAAAYLGVSKGTLEVWACTKRYPLPYVKIGRLVKYRKSVLRAFIKSRTIG